MANDQEIAKRVTLAAEIIKSAQPKLRKEATIASLALLSLSKQLDTSKAARLIKLFDEFVKL